MIVSPVPTKRLDLESMSPEFMKALLSGQRAEAETIAGLDLPADLPGDDERRRSDACRRFADRVAGLTLFR